MTARSIQQAADQELIEAVYAWGRLNLTGYPGMAANGLDVALTKHQQVALDEPLSGWWHMRVRRYEGETIQ